MMRFRREFGIAVSSTRSTFRPNRFSSLALKSKYWPDEVSVITVLNLTTKSMSLESASKSPRRIDPKTARLVTPKSWHRRSISLRCAVINGRSVLDDGLGASGTPGSSKPEPEPEVRATEPRDAFHVVM